MKPASPINSARRNPCLLGRRASINNGRSANAPKSASVRTPRPHNPLLQPTDTQTEEDGGTSLTPCDDGSVCCGSENTDCCDAGGGVLINFYGDLVDPITVTVSEITPTGTTSLESLKLTGTQTQRGLNDATADAAVTSDETSSSSDHSTPMTPAVKGGIAAGVIAVVLALVVVAWVFVRERKRKREGAPSDLDMQRAGFLASERAVDHKAGYASPAAVSGLRELPRGYMRPEPRDTKRFELDGRSFGSEEAVARKY